MTFQEWSDLVRTCQEFVDDPTFETWAMAEWLTGMTVNPGRLYQEFMRRSAARLPRN